MPGFYSKKNSSAKTAPSTSSRKPPIVVVRKEGPSPEILRTEKETEVHLKLADTTPDFQGTEPLLSKIIPTDQSSLSNSLGPIPNCVERKFDELFEERLQEIDCEINKFDTNKESDMEKQRGKNKEELVQQFVVNERASPAKVYSCALSSPISTRGTKVVSLDPTHTSELNARRWKRIDRSDMGTDIIMEDAVREKRSNREEDQPELLRKKKNSFSGR